MPETEHYQEVIRLLKNNSTVQNPTYDFKSLKDIDELIFDELWRWIKIFSSKRDARSIFFIVIIFDKIRCETKKLNYTSRGEVIRLAKIRTELLSLPIFQFTHFFTIHNIGKMLLPKSERVIFTEHHLFFEARNYEKGSLRELRNHDFAKVTIDIETHKKLHADIKGNFLDNPPIISEKTARSLLNILAKISIQQHKKVDDSQKAKTLLNSLKILVEDFSKNYEESPTFENSELLIESLKLRRFIYAQSKWINKFTVKV